MMRSFAMLEKLEEFELALADYYDWLGAHFEHDREAFKTFTRLRVEEQDHAEIVRQHREAVAQDRTKTVPLAANVDDVNRLLELIARFRAQSREPDLCKAIDLAKGLEMTAAMRLHRSTSVEKNHDRAPFVERLAAEGMKHVEVLDALRTRVLGLDL
jgi:rubrerythrin